MALTPQEIEVVKKLKAEGKTTSEIMGFIGGSRGGRPSSISTSSPEMAQQSDFLKDAWETTKNVGKTLYGAGQNVAESYKASQTGERNPIAAGFDIAGDIVGGVSKAAGDVILGAGKMALSQESEDKVADTVKGVIQPIAESPEVKSLVEKFQSLDEYTKQNLRTAGNIGMALVDILTLKGGGAAIDAGTDALKTGTKTLTSIFTDSAPLKTVDDIVEFAASKQEALKPVEQTVKGTTRTVAEQTAPKLSIKEEMIGLDPAIKRQLNGATKETKEAIDVAIAHNLDSNNPTLMEYLGDNVRKAADEMEKLLNDTGSQIGKARQKLATYEAGIDDVKSIEDVFRKEADRLNLSITEDGRMVPKKGTVAKVTSQGDVKALETLYREFRTVKESPRLTNLLDFRNLVQTNIKFGQTAREISNLVDPLARKVRSSVADILAKIVGKSEAGRLQEYTDFIDAFTDIKGFTDRRAGGEYLLRNVMSGTGGEARTIINTIRNFTGRDLMTDATLLGVVTDLFGNKTQKTLLTQAMENAGLSSVRLLKGDPTATLPVLGNWLKQKFVDPEKILLEATKSAKK